eukprot:5562859-Amphidinium_carterae.1
MAQECSLRSGPREALAMHTLNVAAFDVIAVCGCMQAVPRGRKTTSVRVPSEAQNAEESYVSTLLLSLLFLIIFYPGCDIPEILHLGGLPKSENNGTGVC